MTDLLGDRRFGSWMATNQRHRHGDGDGGGRETMVEAGQTVDELVERPVLGREPRLGGGDQRSVRPSGLGPMRPGVGLSEGLRAQVDAIDTEQPLEQAGSTCLLTGVGAPITAWMGKEALVAEAVSRAGIGGVL
jgi:hypothetical protein